MPSLAPNPSTPNPLDRTPPRPSARPLTSRPGRRALEPMGTPRLPSRPPRPLTPTCDGGAPILRFTRESRAAELLSGLGEPPAPPLGTLPAPGPTWAPPTPAAPLAARTLDAIEATCADWLGTVGVPEPQLELWATLCGARPPCPVTRDVAVALLQDWLLFDAPWPGQPAPLLARAAQAAARGAPELAEGLRATAGSVLASWRVEGHAAGHRVRLRHWDPCHPWPHPVEARFPTHLSLPPAGLGLIARLLPDVGAQALRLSPAFLSFAGPHAHTPRDPRLDAPALLGVWLTHHRAAQERLMTLTRARGEGRRAG